MSSWTELVLVKAMTWYMHEDRAHKVIDRGIEVMETRHSVLSSKLLFKDSLS